MKVILAGSNSYSLAEDIGRILKMESYRAEVRKFPDGEHYIRVDADVKGKEVVIVQTMFPNQNDSLVEFLFTIDALRDFGATTVTGVVPYLAYSRQDKRFQPTEVLSIKTVAKLLKHVGLDRLITVDTHYKHVKPGEFDLFGLPSTNLSAGKTLLEYVRKEMKSDFITIGPDFGSSEMIKYATGKDTVLKKEKFCPICELKSTLCKCSEKDKKYEVRYIEDYDFSGKNILIMDDMIASGSTMIKAIDKVRSSGARKVAAAATHGLFLKDSLNALKEKTDYLVVTDSISTPVSNVSIAPLIAETLK